MIPLQKHDSSIVVSTHTYESTVIDAPLASIWHLLRSFSLDKILPSHVKKRYFYNIELVLDIFLFFNFD